MAEQELAVVLRLIADQFQSELKKSQGLVGEFTSFLGNWKTQLAGAGTALFAVAKMTANYGEDLLNTSQKVGVGVEALAGLRHAAKLANLEQLQLTLGLKFLSQNIVEAAAGTMDGGSQFLRLGLSVQDATGKLKPTEKVLFDVAERFAGMKDGAAKTELAIKLFGKAGIEMIPILNQGKAGLQGAMEEARKLGLVMSVDDVQAADAFNDAFDRLMAAVRGLMFQIGKELIPVFTDLADAMTAIATGPAGAGLKFFLKGLRSEFALAASAAEGFAAVLKFLDTITGGTFGAVGGIAKGLTAKGKAEIQAAWSELKAQLEVIGIEAEQKQRDIFEGKKPAAPLPDRRVAAPLPFDREGAIKALEARKKAAAQAIKEEADIIKTGFQTQAILVEQDALQLNLGEVSRSQQKLALRRKEIDELGALLIKEKELEVVSFDERKALGFKNAAERQKVAAEHAAALGAIDSSVRKSQVERQNAGHQADLERMQSTTTAQVELGRFISQMETDRLKAAEAARKQNLTAELAYRRALLEQAETDFAGSAALAKRRGNILDAELAQSLGLSTEHLARISELTHVTYVDDVADIIETLKELPVAVELNEAEIFGIVQSWAAKRERERRRERDEFTSGWMEGLHKYVTDTTSMFSLGVDLARQTAQAMTQAFQRFFFDLFEGKIRTFKDVLKSVLDFTKQIIAQVAASLATNALLRFALTLGAPSVQAGPLFDAPPVPSASASNVFANAGLSLVPAQRFAIGGPVFSNNDRVPAILTVGEGILNTRAMAKLERANQGLFEGGVSNVTVNIQNSGRADKPDVNVRNQFGQMVIDVIFRDFRRNGPIRGLLQGT